MNIYNSPLSNDSSIDSGTADSPSLSDKVIYRLGTKQAQPELLYSRDARPNRKYRIALYSHDTMGLGHFRRNLSIAQALASTIDPTVLMLAGVHQAGSFDLPAGVDCLTLPALHKEASGKYVPRHLDISLNKLIQLRASILKAALESFSPDLLIVDNVPRGAVQELDPALNFLRNRKPRTRCVLGLRDIRDNPEVVQAEWARDGNEQAVRDFYDEVWIYGDPAVYDLIGECQYSQKVAAKAHYTGYLNQRERSGFSAAGGLDAVAKLGLPPGKIALCMVGGGQDGTQLARTFAETELPSGYNGVLLTGPFMPGEDKQFLHAKDDANPRLRVLDFVSEPTALLSQADRVITMGGYNSVCEVLSFEKPALIVPRVTPRQEQWIRAERLRDLGVTDVLHPDDLSSQALNAWLKRETKSPKVHSRINLNGLAALPHMARELLEPRLAA